MSASVITFLACADCGKPVHPDQYFYARGAIEGMTAISRSSSGESRAVFVQCCRGPRTLSATRHARPDERCLSFWSSTDEQQTDSETPCAICGVSRNCHAWRCERCEFVADSGESPHPKHDCVEFLREKLRLRDTLLSKEQDRIALRDEIIRIARDALSEAALVDLVATTRDNLYVQMTAPGSKSIRDRVADVNLVAIVRGFLAVRAPSFGAIVTPPAPAAPVSPASPTSPPIASPTSSPIAPAASLPSRDLP